MQLTSHADGDVLLVAGVGVFTQRQHELVRGYIRSEGADCAAVVLDLRLVVYAIGPHGWASLATATASVPVLPLSVVVAPDHLESAQQYCRSLAYAGLARQAYWAYPPALAWVRLRARMASACPA